MSAQHLAVLAVIVLACILGSLVYKRFPDRIKKTTGLCIGLAVAAMDLVHYPAYYRLGILSVNAIPLHLCAMAVYICLLHSIWQIDWLGQVLYDLCLPGACCALLFPDWSGYPIFSYPSLHSFTTHGLIVVYIIIQLVSKRIIPKLSAIWKPALFLCIAAAVAAAVNKTLGTNFMFISYASPGSPLELLWNMAGGVHAVYLLLFGILAAVVMVLMYIPSTFRRL